MVNEGRKGSFFSFYIFFVFLCSKLVNNEAKFSMIHIRIVNLIMIWFILTMNETSNTNNLSRRCKRRWKQNFNSICISFETLNIPDKTVNHLGIGKSSCREWRQNFNIVEWMAIWGRGIDWSGEQLGFL